MTYGLYDASILVAKDALASLSAILKKAESSAQASTIPTAKIHESMFPFTFQVYLATSLAAKLAARSTGTEPKEYEYDAHTYEAMHARIAEATALLEGVDAAVVNSRAEEMVGMGMGPGKPDVDVKLWGYVNGYAVPNILFHVVTAYDILRKEGVEIGKLDYLKPFVVKHMPAHMQ